ncbi:uncharacterized protein LOC111362536 [Spodoptera litura]|uniref:Uncharacterized protein LOC111362536 n=1 Tax=Spodoptera litura TaxID=69820 RepID=A0A9J7EU46_SPOLT|nr:uncharacterized protein LOC111362536 [Spodoptera litura]
MSTPAAKSRMKKIMQLITPPLPAQESYPETAFTENIQQDTESVLDSYLPPGNNNETDIESILSGATSPSIVDFICNTDLNFEQNTNSCTTLPSTKLVEYSDSDTDNSYTLMDLDNQNEIPHVDITKNGQTNLEDPAMSTFFNRLIEPSTSSLSDQQEQNVLRKSFESHNVSDYIDSEESWKPASSSSGSDEDESAQQIEEETSVVLLKEDIGK